MLATQRAPVRPQGRVRRGPPLRTHRAGVGQATQRVQGRAWHEPPYVTESSSMPRRHADCVEILASPRRTRAAPVPGVAAARSRPAERRIKACSYSYGYEDLYYSVVKTA